MELYNQTKYESFHTHTEEEIPLFVTYLNTIIIIMVAAVVITPGVMVINVIWWTKQLHTKYACY